MAKSCALCCKFQFESLPLRQMGNFMRQQEARKEGKEKDKVRREKLAGFFYDIAKLSFAGLVIGFVMPIFSDMRNENNWYVIIIGVVLTVLSALLANKILK
ncbi:MAG: hypothetical protein Q4D36_01135 [Bacteroidales bacterium]|nr:hypothetical protein [Bacteroidales bacterium]